jgi:proteasome assembly chaperone (PAC2) family protein
MDELRWDRRPEALREPVMVAAFGGWNDAAAAASHALTFVGERFAAERVATIDPEGFYDFQATRPLVDLSSPDASEIVWPDMEILAAEVPEGDHDLVLAAGAEPSVRWRTFCGLILDVANELGVRRLVTMGSLLADVVHSRPVRLTGMASHPTLIADLGFRQPSYTGPTGIVGVLHQAAVDRGMDAVSLWAPVSHYAAGLTNTKGSLALVRALERVSGVSMDARELEKAADTFEGQVSRAVAAEPRLQQLVDQLEAGAGDESTSFGPLPTGDELAEELERFLREQGDDPA